MLHLTVYLLTAVVAQGSNRSRANTVLTIGSVGSVRSVGSSLQTGTTLPSEPQAQQGPTVAPPRIVSNPNGLVQLLRWAAAASVWCLSLYVALVVSCLWMVSVFVCGSLSVAVVSTVSGVSVSIVSGVCW